MATIDTHAALNQIQDIIKQTTAGMNVHERAAFEKEIARLLTLKDEYNGWQNYETWAMSLYLSNDESTYEATNSVIVETWNEAKPWAAADALRDWVKSFIPEGEIQIVVSRPHNTRAARDIHANINYATADIFEAGLDRVNWSKIVEQFRTE